MDKGLWVWSSNPKEQRKVLGRIAESPHLMAAFTGVAKSKEGLSNSEVDDLLANNSNWMTLWSTRQLTSLGFIEYRVDLFGGPGRYNATQLGRNALAAITGQPAQPTPQTPAAAPPAQAPAPKQ